VAKKKARDTEIDGERVNDEVWDRKCAREERETLFSPPSPTHAHTRALLKSRALFAAARESEEWAQSIIFRDDGKSGNARCKISWW